MRTVILPADDGFLPEQATQWWYWTGHLATAGGRRFGFELCWFAFHADVLLGQTIGDHLGREGFIDRLTDYAGFQMVNVAMTDVAGQRYLADTLFAAGHPKERPAAFDLASQWPHAGAVTAAGGNGSDRLHAARHAWGFDLTVTNDNATHPPVLQYGGNLHKYCFGGYTYYYSRPGMRASGTVNLGGAPCAVDGTVWFDRQYGELNQAVNCGWQWFAMQFDDDRQVMVFDITGQPLERYAASSENRIVRVFTPEEIDVQVLSHWTSPRTAISYPAKWEVTFGGETVVVTPQVADQEMKEPWPWPAYWEGACLIASPDGRRVGQAYVELSGFKKLASPKQNVTPREGGAGG